MTNNFVKLETKQKKNCKQLNETITMIEIYIDDRSLETGEKGSVLYMEIKEYNNYDDKH